MASAPLMDWVVRMATEADAAVIAALIRRAFAAQERLTDPPPSALAETASSVAATLAAGGGAVAVDRDGAVRGSVLWSVRPDRLTLGRLAVDPPCRRRGLGRRLLDAAAAEARRRCLLRLELGTRLVLQGNRALFAAAGFEEVGLDTHPGFAAPTSVRLERRVGDGFACGRPRGDQDRPSCASSVP